jgi:NAD(P) transhydrogenase
MTVLGAGVVGIEYASLFAALGIAVTLVDTRDRLLPYFDREVVATLVRELGELGVTIHHDDRYAHVSRTGGAPPRVACETQAGRRLESDVLLYCVGRDGNTNDIGLGTLGIQPGKYGLLEVGASYQTAHPHIYAVGDVVGYPALASTAMEQGRQAMRHAFSIPGPKGRTEALPFAVYAIPELAYIGETEESLVAKKVDYVAGRGDYAQNPRGQILGDSDGLLKLVFERPSLRLVGAHIVGTAASELIHIGEAFLHQGATATEIAETIYNYPTLSDMYRHAAVKALAEDRRRAKG